MPSVAHRRQNRKDFSAGVYRLSEHKIEVSQMFDAAKKYATFKKTFVNTHW